MNSYQKFYDSYNQNNINLKITNSYYHFKNIQKILYRKPEYKPMRNLNSPKYKINTKPYYNYFLTKDNNLFKKVLNDIRTTKARPKLNDYYKEKEEKLRNYRKHYKTLENRQLTRENLNFQRRLKNQKSMLRIRDMDKDYKKNHLKNLQISRKIKDLKSIIFPPITRIVTKMDSAKKTRNYNYDQNSSYEKSISKSINSVSRGESLNKNNYRQSIVKNTEQNFVNINI